MNKDCGFVERTSTRWKGALGGVLAALFGVTIFGFASPVHGAAKPKPEYVMKGYQKEVRLLTELLQEEKDPEVRKELIARRTEASKNARLVAQKILESGR